MRAVTLDLGGVLTESPMAAFAAYEAEAGMRTIKGVEPAAALAELAGLTGVHLDGAA